MSKTALTALFLLASVDALWAQQPPAYDGRPKITVTGEAVVKVKPDRIVISFGIEAWDASINVAKEKHNDILKQALTGFKDSGLPEKAIQTEHLSIQPRWESEHTRRSFIAYFVRSTLVVTLSEVEKVEAVVTAALESGVTYIHGVNFQTTELKKHREQARELALKAAKEKADKMSAVLGQTAGIPIQISENYGGMPGFYWSSWHGWGYGWGRSSGMSQVQVQADSGSSGEIADNLVLGQLSIRANVSVTFELRD
jgi:uncharacterized protein